MAGDKRPTAAGKIREALRRRGIGAIIPTKENKQRQPGTKPALALEELDRLCASGARFDTVVADAGYGHGAEFRQGLSERRLAWAVGVPSTQSVYTTAVELT